MAEYQTRHHRPRARAPHLEPLAQAHPQKQCSEVRSGTQDSPFICQCCQSSPRSVVPPPLRSTIQTLPVRERAWGILHSLLAIARRREEDGQDATQETWSPSCFACSWCGQTLIHPHIRLRQGSRAGHRIVVVIVEMPTSERADIRAGMPPRVQQGHDTLRYTSFDTSIESDPSVMPGARICASKDRRRCFCARVTAWDACPLDTSLNRPTTPWGRSLDDEGPSMI